MTHASGIVASSETIKALKDAKDDFGLRAIKLQIEADSIVVNEKFKVEGIDSAGQKAVPMHVLS